MLTFFFAIAGKPVSAYEIINDMFSPAGGYVEGGLYAVSRFNMQPYASTGQPAGQIIVSSNLAEASFSLSGPLAYTGSGQSWSQNDAMPGSYLITYHPVSCWQSPASESGILTDGGILEFTGTYTDNTAPTAPVNVQSNPLPEVWINSGTISVTWNTGTDCGSGVAGYSYIWDTSPGTLPDNKKETAGTAALSPILSDGSSHYFHVRTVDMEGNLSPTVHAGPFFIDTVTHVSIENSQICTDQAEFLLSGQREAEGTVEIECTGAAVGAVQYPSSETWEVMLSSIAVGTGTVTVRISDRAGNQASAQARLQRMIPVSAVFSKDSDTLVADGVSLLPIVISLKNSMGQNLCDGIPIRVTTDLGEVSPDIYVTENGQIICGLKASRDLGMATVSAWTGQTLLGSTSVQMTAGPLKRMVFTSAPQNIEINAPSGFIQVQTQDVYGHPVAVTQNTDFWISSTSSISGEFYIRDATWYWNQGDAIVTLTAGNDTLLFKYRDSLKGRHSITVSEFPDQNWWNASQDITVSAVQQYRLNLESGGKGTGTVLSYPAGIDCGEDCEMYFDENTVVSLSPIPAPGYVFKGWSGGCTGTGNCSVTMTADMTVKAEFEKTAFISKAIIVAGGGPSAGNWVNHIWESTLLCAEYAYGALLHQGFTHEDIFYLNSDTQNTNADREATSANLQYALSEWAGESGKEADELLIYMVDHGGKESFRMNAGEIMQAVQLDTWLDTLQNTMPGRLILVYDACQSGTFLNRLSPTGEQERIIITSASDESAYFLNRGRNSFSYHFWATVYEGAYLDDTFFFARDMMAAFQSSQLEADGNGIGNEKADKAMTAGIVIGKGLMSLSDMPLMKSVSGEQTVSGTGKITLRTGPVTDADGIGKVWGFVIPPCYDPGSPDTPVTDLPEVSLYDKDHDGEYEADYGDFIYKGVYRIIIYAEDANGTVSLPEYTTVMQTEGISCARGDMNDDGLVNLADAILVLQLQAGMEVSLSVNTETDINGDGKIGMEEALYVLRKVSGL